MLRDLAKQEVEMGGVKPPKDSLFALAVDCLSSNPGGWIFGSPEHKEFVCGQLYAAANDAEPDEVEQYVEDLIDLLELESWGDANDVPRRLKENYEGQLMMVRDKQTSP